MEVECCKELINKSIRLYLPVLIMLCNVGGL